MAEGEYNRDAIPRARPAKALAAPDHFIADLGLSKAYLHEDQFFPGWTVVVFKRHATELFHLAPTERFQLIEEVSMVAKIADRDVRHQKNELRACSATSCPISTGISFPDWRK